MNPYGSAQSGPVESGERQRKVQWWYRNYKQNVYGDSNGCILNPSDIIGLNLHVLTVPISSNPVYHHTRSVGKNRLAPRARLYMMRVYITSRLLPSGSWERHSTHVFSPSTVPSRTTGIPSMPPYSAVPRYTRQMRFSDLTVFEISIHRGRKYSRTNNLI